MGLLASELLYLLFDSLICSPRVVSYSLFQQRRMLCWVEQHRTLSLESTSLRHFPFLPMDRLAALIPDKPPKGPDLRASPEEEEEEVLELKRTGLTEAESECCI